MAAQGKARLARENAELKDEIARLSHQVEQLEAVIENRGIADSDLYHLKVALYATDPRLRPKLHQRVHEFADMIARGVKQDKDGRFHDDGRVCRDRREVKASALVMFYEQILEHPEVCDLQ